MKKSRGSLARSASPGPRPPPPQQQQQQQHAELSEIERIRNMLNSPMASIEMLTCGSAKGFMFEMTVLPEHSAFYNPGERTDPITSFIVKLAVTSQQNDEDLGVYVPINNGTPVEKSTETAESYFQEAKLQQDVWMKTVAGNRLPISPPIVSFSLFDNQNGRNFLTFLNYKVKKPKSVHTVKYLSGVLQNPAYGLGMIIMSKVLHSDTFEGFLDEEASFQGVPITDHVVDDVYAKLFSKIVRLFIEIGVIHFDLHMKNALIYLHRHNSLNAYIIDYGRASSVKDATTNDYLGPSEKQPLRTKSEELHKQIFDLCHPGKRSAQPPSASVKIDFISNAIEMLRRLEHSKSQQLYGNPETYSHSRYQFDWMEELIPMTSQMVTRHTGTSKKERFNKIAVRAFDNLCTEITRDVDDSVEYSLPTIRKSCLHFEGRDHSDFQTHFLATWTEWAKSLYPRTLRKLSSFLTRNGGRKGRGAGRKTRKIHKIKRNRPKRNKTK
jgi:hypothetical protein